MSKRFTRRRWRRPERLTLEHPPVSRRKDINVPSVLTLEAALARRSSRRRLELLLVIFLFLCALEGALIGALTGRWILVPVLMGLGILYFFVGREWGDGWLRRSMRARTKGTARLQRLAAAEARSAGVTPPEVLVAPGAEPNAIAVALRRRAILVTSSCEDIDELVLEAMLAHEVIHLRDGDAAVISLFMVLAGAPELLARRAGVGCLLGLPVWPAAFAMRLGRAIAAPPDREHRADVAAAMLTRYPPGIVSALGAAGGRTSGLGVSDGFWFVRRDGTRGDVRHRAELVGEM